VVTSTNTAVVQPSAVSVAKIASVEKPKPVVTSINTAVVQPSAVPVVKVASVEKPKPVVTSINTAVVQPSAVPVAKVVSVEKPKPIMTSNNAALVKAFEMPVTKVDVNPVVKKDLPVSDKTSVNKVVSINEAKFAVKQDSDKTPSSLVKEPIAKVFTMPIKKVSTEVTTGIIKVVKSAGAEPLSKLPPADDRKY